MIVASILTDKGSDVATVSASETLGAVCKLLVAKRIGAIVIATDEGGVDGIISERDIVRAIAQEGAPALDRQVSAFMTRSVTTCHRSDTVDQLMQVMTGGRFRHLPVVDNGKLCGIISIGDVVKHRIAETEQEAASLKEYIASG